MSFQLPKQGLVFWPVNCGDSSTIVIDETTVIQIDLNHMCQSEEDDDPASPVIDELVKVLPKVDGKSYLSAFILTHPDLDHCRGFADLLKRVRIGELWFSPRVFWEFKKDLSDDARAFCEEAYRRVKKVSTDGSATKAGDRIRVIGYDSLLKKDEFKDIPLDRLTIPGNFVTEVDGSDHATSFRAFIHAPFKDDISGERNETSIALQVRLISGASQGNALFFGDLAYPTLKRIYTETKDKSNLHWNVILTPHHCSKSAMYWKDEDKDEETLKKDILNDFESTQLTPNCIVASCMSVPAANEPGDNPPHAIAKVQYEKITEAFHCTHEHIDPEMPHPIVFELTQEGLCYQRPAGNLKAKTDRVAHAVTAARGIAEPPKERVGFGKKN